MVRTFLKAYMERVCLLLQYLLQSCSRRGRGLTITMFVAWGISNTVCVYYCSTSTYYKAVRVGGGG